MTPVLHSVSYTGVWPGQMRLALDDFIAKARSLGFSGLMLMGKRPHLSVLDYDERACRDVRERIEKLGLRCHVIAGYNNFTADLEHGDVPHREIQIQHITALARMAHWVGAGVVRIFTGYEHPAATYTALWNMTVDAIRECARRAADFGVTIGVQNHHDLAADHNSLFDLIQAVNEPNCRAIFDAWAPALHGTDLPVAARKMGPITCHTTVADYQLRPRFQYHSPLVNYEAKLPWTQAVPMGEGFIDYRGFLTALVQGGYQGPVAYEMCSPLLGGGSEENLDRYARRFVSYLAELSAALEPETAAAPR